MKMWKMWKAAKILTEGDGTGQAGSGIGAAIGRMNEVMAEGLEAVGGADRGAPLPGTDVEAGQRQDPVALADGIAVVQRRDPAFDPDSFLAFVDQVFTAVTRSFAAGQPDVARPVMSDRLWEPIVAAAATGASAWAWAEASGVETATSSLIGAHSDGLYDSALIEFSVHIPALAQSQAATWPEEWLFQRSVIAGGDPMEVVAPCPSCGSPVGADSSGACTVCHHLIPVRTVGWLVTEIVSHNPMIEYMNNDLLKQAAENPNALRGIPDAYLRQIPPERLAAVAPEVAARLYPAGGKDALG